MKKAAAVIAVMVMVIALVSSVFAADAMKGTVKSVDAKAGTIVLSMDGKDETLKVDASVDLDQVKSGAKVEVTIEKDTVTSLKATKKRAPIGC
jgi:hypothetical protein